MKLTETWFITDSSAPFLSLLKIFLICLLFVGNVSCVNPVVLETN